MRALEAQAPTRGRARVFASARYAARRERQVEIITRGQRGQHRVPCSFQPEKSLGPATPCIVTDPCPIVPTCFGWTRPGTVHPVGKTASRELRARIGEWRLVEGPKDIVLMRRVASASAVTQAGGGDSVARARSATSSRSSRQAGFRGELLILEEEDQKTPLRSTSTAGALSGSRLTCPPSASARRSTASAS